MYLLPATGLTGQCPFSPRSVYARQKLASPEHVSSILTRPRRRLRHRVTLGREIRVCLLCT